jgi:hypothetical protein
MMVADNEPFSAAIFTEFWWGSKLLDDSSRNGLTWDVGVAASLTALSHVTITGRAYAEFFSDRHCPALDSSAPTANGGFETSDPIKVCKDYKMAVVDNVAVPEFTQDDIKRAEKLTGQSGREFFDRDGGVRFNLAIGAEIAMQQRWNVYGILEGAFGGERALFTGMFSGPMPDTDYQLYLRIGTSYKF